jgi:hypothetical protein
MGGRLSNLCLALGILLCVVGTSVQLSGCQVPPWLNVSGTVSSLFSPLIQGVKRDVHKLLAPMIEYPQDIQYNPHAGPLASPPLLDPQLVEALALNESMKEDIRPPLPGISRIYTQNPRRAKARVMPSYHQPLEQSIWQEDALVQGWYYGHANTPAIRQLMPALKDPDAPLPHKYWFTLLEMGLPPSVRQQIPLAVLKQKDTLQRQAWTIQHQYPMVYKGLLDVKPEHPLTRGELIMWAMQLTGYWDEIQKSAADDPYYYEWWASPLAEPDARINLAKGWNGLGSWEQRYLTMAYSLGMLDAVLHTPPPLTAAALSHWPIYWHEPVTTREALRALGWVEHKLADLQ